MVFEPISEPPLPKANSPILQAQTISRYFAAAVFWTPHSATPALNSVIKSGNKGYFFPFTSTTATFVWPVRLNTQHLYHHNDEEPLLTASRKDLLFFLSCRWAVYRVFSIQYNTSHAMKVTVRQMPWINPKPACETSGGLHWTYSKRPIMNFCVTISDIFGENFCCIWSSWKAWHCFQWSWFQPSKGWPKSRVRHRERHRFRF